jgi:hypothetical protein
MSTPLPTADSANLDPPDAVEVDFIDLASEPGS